MTDFLTTALAAAPADDEVRIPSPEQRSLEASVEHYDIRESEYLQPGEMIVAEGVVFMHLRDLIRLRHPRGLAGTIAASLEWQLELIERNAARALRRVDRLALAGAEEATR